MIYEILKQKGAKGPENAITTGQLMAQTKLDIRELRRQVQEERQRHIICGKTYGEGITVLQTGARLRRIGIFLKSV